MITDFYDGQRFISNKGYLIIPERSWRPHDSGHWILQGNTSINSDAPNFYFEDEGRSYQEMISYLNSIGCEEIDKEGNIIKESDDFDLTGAL